jgi:hypothetical protein
MGMKGFSFAFPDILCTWKDKGGKSMNTHDHSTKKPDGRISNQPTQEEPIHDNVTDWSSFSTQAVKTPNKQTVLQLQRTIGNASTQRLISGGAERIQRAEGDKDALAEKQYVTVGSGEQIKWTDLVGGCIAFAFKYSGGGGMGYHLVMNSSEDTQWQELISKVDMGKIASIHMFSDQLNSSEGWRVPMNFDEDMYEAGDAKTSGRITSSVALQGAGINPNQFGDYIDGTTYWSHTWLAVKQWMTGIFGVAPTYEEKMKGVEYTF